MPNEFNSSIFGSYRLDDQYFPAPETEWDDVQISPGLNGIPINQSYRLHRWIFEELEGFLAEDLYAKFSEQQSGNSQLGALETDPYDASGASLTYGTTVYTDFVIQEITTRHRGFPNYEGVTVQFEIFIS